MREKCYGPEIHLLTYKITKKKIFILWEADCLIHPVSTWLFLLQLLYRWKRFVLRETKFIPRVPQADHAVNPNTCYHILGSKNKALLQGLHISFFVPIKMSSCDEMTGQILQKCFLYSLFLFWGFKLLSASLLNESVALLCPTRCGHQKNCEFLCHKTSVS